LSVYQLEKHYSLSFLYEPLLCLLICLPFIIIKDFAPPDLLGKAYVLAWAIPPLLIWLADRIYKAIKSPNLFVLDFSANKLIIGNESYLIDDLKFLYLSGGNDAIAVELEFPSLETFKLGYSIKTLGIYKLDSTLDSFNNAIKHIKNIKTFK